MPRQKRMAKRKGDPNAAKTRSKKQKAVQQVSSAIVIDSDTETQQPNNPPTNTKSLVARKPTTRSTHKISVEVSSPTKPTTSQQDVPEITQTVGTPTQRTPIFPKPKTPTKPNDARTSNEDQNQQTSHNPKISTKPSTPTNPKKVEKDPLDTSTTNLKRTTKKDVVTSKKNSDILSHVDPAASITDLTAKTKFLGPRTLHWKTLEQLDVHQQFSDWMTPLWRRFFDIQLPVYKPLIFEFFTTYRFNKKITETADVTSETSMVFSLRGKQFILSFKEFGVAMGLFGEDEVDGAENREGLTGWPSDVNLNDFWLTFGVGDYQKNISSTSITKPTYRILHRLIAESINQRGSCTNHVTKEDLFYMYCIVNKRPCNIAKCLARYLYKSVGKTESSAVCGGAYVTKLALGLGVVSQKELLSMEILGSTSFFDVSQLKKLEIVEKSPPLRFVEHVNVNECANEETSTTTDADRAARLNYLEAEVKVMKGELRWVSNALHFLISKLGHSFEPPPHVAARDSVNTNLSSSNPPM